MNQYEAASQAGELHRPKSPLETFVLELHGSANGVILIANGRRYVIQLEDDSEASFEQVIAAVEQAYSVHRQRHNESN